MSLLLTGRWPLALKATPKYERVDAIRSTEVWGDFIATPAYTLLITISITRNEVATVE